MFIVNDLNNCSLHFREHHKYNELYQLCCETLCRLLYACLFALAAGLSLKGQAVGAGYFSGISFVSTDLDLIERAVILAAAVVCTVVDSATDVFVSKFSSHNNTSFRFVCRTQKRLYDYYEIF